MGYCFQRSGWRFSPFAPGALEGTLRARMMLVQRRRPRGQTREKWKKIGAETPSR